MTTEEKFNAAVNVIRSLPKNGSYQPSTDMMLRFYGYYKQATQGPCTGSKPPFWDAVGRAKYNAWKSNGTMSASEAMEKYVEELHKIVETMSYNENVANFLEASSNELESVNMNDLELIAGDVLQRVRSQPNSPLASREGSPNRIFSSPSQTSNDEDSFSDDEYIDTIEEPRSTLTPNNTETIVKRQHKSRSKGKNNSSEQSDISEEISKTVQNLRIDLEKLTTRITHLENKCTTNVASRISFSNMQTEVVVFLITWPFIASILLQKLLSFRK